MTEMPLSKKEREDLIENLWADIDVSAHEYNELIARLMKILTDEQLIYFVSDKDRLSPVEIGAAEAAMCVDENELDIEFIEKCVLEHKDKPLSVLKVEFADAFIAHGMRREAKLLACANSLCIAIAVREA